MAKHRADGAFTGIGFDHKRVSLVWDGEDNILSHALFELDEGSVLFGAPFPGRESGKGGERFYDL